ncbi:hypothetical protein A1O3_10030 [Capronia epimyces CBS 606.96]|uniref:Uncharacterized protein n=1 Tax=Capronia epimyces CBS 606.96 TaxID=1182542 RepID=W9XLE9_9EURO|nr:uncharacterized protein A1O3_10030 [Capronia epimyces CBS 606.96]EXJ77801.1 hypothetical protein A1O3_10030 [Capronia epimyces CBS 606.96]
MQSGPSVSSKSRALHFLMRSTASSGEFCSILDMLMASPPSPAPPNPSGLVVSKPSFTEHCNSFDSPLRVLLKTRPGDAYALKRVISSGCDVTAKTEKELIYWAMSQTSPRIKTECVQVLIQLGANANYRVPSSNETMLLMAIRTGRTALIDVLINAGADADAVNERGQSPLLLASELGNSAIVQRLIAAGVSLNNGSLHQAVRSLLPKVVKVLLQHGANPNYRSQMHGGRTPLGEFCLTAKVTASSYQAAVEVLTELERKGADVEERNERKPLICLALGNSDPVMVVQAFMAACLPNRRIDEDFNLYEESSMVYSPTCYVSEGKFLGPPALAHELGKILRRYGCNRDVYYSLTGLQPERARGMPSWIAEKEARRIAREEQIAEDQADHQRRIQRADEEEIRLRRIEQQRHRLIYQQHEDLGKQRLEQARQLASVERERRDYDFQHEQQRHHLRWRSDQERLQLQQIEYAHDETHRQRMLDMETLALSKRQDLELENRRCLDGIKRKAIEHKAGLRDHLSQREHNREIDQLALMAKAPLHLLELGWPHGGGYIKDTGGGYIVDTDGDYIEDTDGGSIKDTDGGYIEDADGGYIEELE